MNAVERFDRYMDHLAGGLGHADRHAGLKGYCSGLMLPLARKSVEPMAARVDPLHASARHQSLHHFVAKAEWSDQELVRRVSQWVVPKMDWSQGGFWIVDDTGFPKKGKHSVGVARQYCGVLGKQDNCQVAVSVTLANHEASVPVAWQLYLPREWADDPLRRNVAGVPAEVEFATKNQIALRQLERLLAEGAPHHCVLTDAGYGVDLAFRQRLTELELPYVVGITSAVGVWPPGPDPLPPARYRGRGRPPSRQRTTRQRQPLSVKALAQTLPAEAFQTVSWREGSNQSLVSRFAAVRVRAARVNRRSVELQPEEWLLIEWPQGDPEPLKYFLSTLPAETAINDLVAQAHLRWRIERDYQDLKQELGLGHYEGRGWRGFHHHASLCIAAYGFLVSERIAAGHVAGAKKNFIERQIPPLPDDYVPRGSPARAASRPRFDHHPAPHANHRSQRPTRSMSMLRAAKST
jgi:SRSO17 transposase